MNDFTPEQLSYLKWLRDTAPEFYADVVQPHLNNNSLGGLGAVGGSSTFSNILDSITDALPTLTTSYAQYAMIKNTLENRTNAIATTTENYTPTNLMPWILGGIGALGLLYFATRK